MKDFIKWLGVNEKIAKVVVWILIIMVTLIIFNEGLNSLGFPNYQITYDNLQNIKSTKMLEYLFSWISTLLNFYATIFLVFRIKEFKKILPYSIIYWLGNILVNQVFNVAVLQAYIYIFIIIFCYYYSNKNKKYIIYAILSIIINIFIEGIVYYFKARLIDYTNIAYTTKVILFSDYFIIMTIIILVKEIYLKKRGENKCQEVYYGSENSKTKTNSQKNLQKK